MPHLGIDYAAPVGTPVRAAGDGKVVEMNRKRGNGRYLKIRHTNSAYESYYLHLSRYAQGVKIGSKVRQGQLIGYVGASGYATGPHLDYRIKKDGVFVNPRKVKLPPAKPVAEDNRNAFLALTERYDRTLDRLPEEAAPHPITLARPAPVVTFWEPLRSPQEHPVRGLPVSGEP
jgi:murein DD-endopeptidase MepM/ murein hydrolase activator NlpD